MARPPCLRRAPLAMLAAVASLAACQADTHPPTPLPGPANAYRTTFEAEPYCTGELDAARVSEYLTEVELALEVPSTKSVTLDDAGRCIRVAVEGVGAGRFVEQMLRALQVPRNAVVVEFAAPPARTS